MPCFECWLLVRSAAIRVHRLWRPAQDRGRFYTCAQADRGGFFSTMNVLPVILCDMLPTMTVSRGGDIPFPEFQRETVGDDAAPFSADKPRAQGYADILADLTRELWRW